MKDFFDTRPFAKIGLLGIPLLLFTFVMEYFFPKSAPEGYESFIVAFEFAKTPEQLHVLFNGFTADMFQNSRIGNYFDYGFMLTYCLFLILTLKKKAKFYHKKWLQIGIPFTILIFLADFSENLVLLKITDIYSPVISDAELLDLLKYLHIITWVKWGGLTIVFTLFAIQHTGRKLQHNIERVVLIAPLILSIWALTNDPMGVSRFSLSIILAFALLIFNAFRIRQIQK